MLHLCTVRKKCVYALSTMPCRVCVCLIIISIYHIHDNVSFPPDILSVYLTLGYNWHQQHGKV